MQFKIFIADDNPDNIHLLQHRLRSKNYSFDTALDGQEALDKIKHTLPDLILLDVDMPKLDGFEVCRRLRANEATRSIPVIFITAARTSIDDQITGLGLGADDYITKPFNPKDLTVRVERKLQIRALENELRRQKEELAAILSSTADAILRIGPDGVVQFLNRAAARRFGLAPTNASDAVGTHYHNAFAQHSNFVTALEQIKERPTSQPVNCEVEMRDGSTLFVNIAPITTSTQQLDGWVLVLRDITHLKEIDHLKSTIIANAAHDLKNPLSSAMLYLEMLVEVMPDQNDRQYNLATSALRSVDLMKQMIIHLLDLERLETGNILELQPCNLVEIVQDLLSQMDGLAQKQDIRLTAELPDAPVMVQGDFVYLSQAILNLLNNAIKFTPNGEAVAVLLKAEGQNAIISVQDTGPGIPPEEQVHIFERFYQVKGQKNVKAMSGSGLGLSIVKTVVTQHHGLVWLESQMGQGTTFCISLPRLVS